MSEAATVLTAEMLRDAARTLRTPHNQTVGYHINYALDGVTVSGWMLIEYAQMYGHDGSMGEPAKAEAIRLLRENGHRVKLPYVEDGMNCGYCRDCKWWQQGFPHSAPNFGVCAYDRGMQPPLIKTCGPLRTVLTQPDFGCPRFETKEIA